MFKTNFINLCNLKNVSPSAVCKQIGISPAAYSQWTNKSIPREATLQKLAIYFDVPVDYLIGKSEEKKSVTTNSNELINLTEQEKILLNSFRETSEEGRQRIIQSVLNIHDEFERREAEKNSKATS